MFVQFQCFVSIKLFHSFKYLSWQRFKFRQCIYNIQLSGCRLARSAPPSQDSAPPLLLTILLSTSYRDQSDPLSLPPPPFYHLTVAISAVTCLRLLIRRHEQMFTPSPSSCRLTSCSDSFIMRLGKLTRSSWLI